MRASSRRLFPSDAPVPLDRMIGRRGDVEQLAEAIDEKAGRLHASRRPRLGIARSTDGLSAAESTAEPIAYSPS